MKKVVITLILFVAAVSGALAQDAVSISSIFASIPEHVIYGLDDEQKIRLTENASDTTISILDNDLYNEIKRTAMTDSYISLQTSSVGNVQIKLLPLINGSNVICVVKSVCKNICDSEISFYTTKWVPIDFSHLLPKIGIENFIRKDVNRNSDDYKNAVAALDINPIKITLLPNDDGANIEYDIKNYLSKEDYEKITPYLIQKPIVLTWDKASFK